MLSQLRLLLVRKVQLPGFVANMLDGQEIADRTAQTLNLIRRRYSQPEAITVGSGTTPMIFENLFACRFTAAARVSAKVERHVRNHEVRLVIVNLAGLGFANDCIMSGDSPFQHFLDTFLDLAFVSSYGVGFLLDQQ